MKQFLMTMGVIELQKSRGQVTDLTTRDKVNLIIVKCGKVGMVPGGVNSLE